MAFSDFGEADAAAGGEDIVDGAHGGVGVVREGEDGAGAFDLAGDGLDLRDGCRVRRVSAETGSATAMVSTPIWMGRVQPVTS